MNERETWNSKSQSVELHMAGLLNVVMRGQPDTGTAIAMAMHLFPPPPPTQAAEEEREECIHPVPPPGF